MRYALLFAFAILTLAFACNKKVSDATSTSTPMDNNSPIMKTLAFGEAGSLKIGEGFTLQNSEVTFKFAEVNLDSRCPKGLNCIQAGEAQVTVLVNGQPQRVTIDVDYKTTARVRIPGGTVEIASLAPYPEAEVKIKPEDRRLKIKVVKSADM